MKLSMVRQSRLLLCSLAPLCAALVGCGEGISRHVVSGKVTYQGQGVEYGTIVFEPEASVGNVAPTAMARIENGLFETSADDSPVAGAYKVRVLGFDKSKMKTSGEGEGQIVETPELFPEYVLHVEIPPPGGRLDIDVPGPAPAGADN